MSRNRIRYEDILDVGFDLSNVGMPLNYEATLSDFVSEYKTKITIDNLLRILLRVEIISFDKILLLALWSVEQISYLVRDEYGLIAAAFVRSQVLGHFTFSREVLFGLRTTIAVLEENFPSLNELTFVTFQDKAEQAAIQAVIGLLDAFAWNQRNEATYAIRKASSAVGYVAVIMDKTDSWFDLYARVKHSFHKAQVNKLLEYLDE